MAVPEALGGMVGNLKDMGSTIFIWLGVMAIIAGIAYGLYMLMRNWMKYDYDVLIIKKDMFGHNDIVIDKGGVLTKQNDEVKRFFLKGLGRGIKSKDIPYKKIRGKKTVFMSLSGEAGLRFIRDFAVDEKGLRVTVDDEDINWGLHDYRKLKEAYKAGGWQQFIPHIMFIITIVMIVILMISFSKQWSKTMAESGSMFVEATKNLAEAAKYLAEARGGTVIVPAG